MASEYLKWKYRDVRPDAPAERTKKQRLQNWWHYHKWHIGVGIAAVAIAGNLAWHALTQVHPDYQIAYVGAYPLSEEEAAAWEERLSALGTDCGFMVPQEYEGQEDGLQLPMKVLSNRQQLNGAACMLYPGVLDQIAAQMGCGFYILPSSVHEVILLPDRGEEDPGSLKSMVVQVNRTQVPREDILTDSLYCFDPAQKAMKKIL